jgi:hypothetical protein
MSFVGWRQQKETEKTTRSSTYRGRAIVSNRTIDGGAQQCNNAMIHGGLRLQIYVYRTETSYGIAKPDLNYEDRFL